ncbi:MAG: hypothetical protein KC645_16720 [Gemmatimonadetes bacterium]|nr:hypothetical protein [Gemmatimonadota bacterium]
MDSPAAARPSWSLLVFLALAGTTAALLGTAVHEVLGHGLVALLLGGRFHDVYVGVLDGQAGAVASGPRNAVVLAAGALSELLLGAAAWIALRRRLRGDPSRSHGGMRPFLWLLAQHSVLAGWVYMTAGPALATASGGTGGDWTLLFRTWGVPPLPLFVVGLIGAVPLTASLMRDAVRVTAAAGIGARPASRRQPSVAEERLAASARAAPVSDPPSAAHAGLRAFTLLVLPSIVLRSLYAVAVAPWRSAPLLPTLGDLFDDLLLAGLAALWLRWRPGASHRSPTPVGDPPAPARLAGWNGFLLGAVGVTLLVFGPTQELRRGLSIGPSSPDQYIGVAQRLELTVDLSDSSASLLQVRSTPRPGVGARYRRRLTAELAERGPSPSGARELTAFMARWNVDGARVADLSTPRAEGDAWTWEARLENVPDPLILRVWPLTWVQESRVERVRIVGARVLAATDGGRVGTDGEDVVWTRPQDARQVDSVVVAWRRR